MHQTQAVEHESEAAQPAPRLGRAIVLTSGKGGVGKTTTTANLGTALASRGVKVVLVDADVGLRNLDILLGLESRVKHHLLDVLEERASLDDALVPSKHGDTLYLLAAAQSREKDEVETEKMKALIEVLRERFDYVLIDCPAGIELGFRNAVAGADEAIVICTPEVSAVRDVDRVVGLLGNRFRPQLIINRLRPALVRKGKMLSVEDVNAILRLPLARRDRRRTRHHRDDEPGRAARPAAGESHRRRLSRDRRAGRRRRRPRADAASLEAVVHGTSELLFGRKARVIEFLKRLFGQSGSSATAKERLRLVLMTDHLELAPEMIERLKADLVDVISRHVEVDRDRIEVNFERQDTALALLANIPIISVNRPNGNGSHGNGSNGGAPVEAVAETAPAPAVAQDAVASEAPAPKKKPAADATPPVRKRRRRKKNAAANAAAAPTPT